MADSEVIALLRELNRVKVLFQARAVAAALDLPPATLSPDQSTPMEEADD